MGIGSLLLLLMGVLGRGCSAAVGGVESSAGVWSACGVWWGVAPLCQKRGQRRIVFYRLRAEALQHHYAVDADGVTDPIALAQPHGPPHRLLHGCLVAVFES